MQFLPRDVIAMFSLRRIFFLSYITVDSDEVDDENEISICQILRATGASYPVAHRAAIRIQVLQFIIFFHNFPISKQKKDYFIEKLVLTNTQNLVIITSVSSQQSKSDLVICDTFHERNNQARKSKMKKKKRASGETRQIARNHHSHMRNISGPY